MSTYFNRTMGDRLQIDSLDCPSYLKLYLRHLRVTKGLTDRSVITYYEGIRRFIQWASVRHMSKMPSAVEIDKIEIANIPIEVITEIDTLDILSYLSYLEDTRKNGKASRTVRLAAIRSFYEYLITVIKVTDTDPTLGISAPKSDKKLPIYLSLDECGEFLSSISGRDAERDTCLFTLLLYCGLRVTELVTIKLSDIQNNSIRIYGKGQKERVVYLNQQCLDALEIYIPIRNSIPEAADYDQLFFSKHTKKPITARRVEQIMDKYLLKSGLSGKKYSPHKLRHTSHEQNSKN